MSGGVNIDINLNLSGLNSDISKAEQELAKIKDPQITFKVSKSGLDEVKKEAAGLEDIQVPVGYKLDKNGRLRDEFGRYVKDAGSDIPVGLDDRPAKGALSGLKSFFLKQADDIGRGFKERIGANIAQGVQGAVAGIAGGAVSGVSNFIGESVGKFEQFSSVITDFGAKVGGTEEEIKAISAAAKQLGADTSQTPVQVAQAAVAFGKLGFAAGQVKKELPGLVDLAEATGAAPEEAAEVAAKAYNVFGLEVKRTADIIAATDLGSSANIQDFNQLLADAGGVAKAEKVSLESLAAAFGLLKDSGFSAATAGNAIKILISRLGAPSTKEAATAIKDLGVEVREASGQFKDPIKLISELRTAIERFDPARRAQLTKTIFGDEGAPAFNSLISLSQNKIDSFYNSIVNSSEKAGTVATKRLAGFSSSLQQLGGSLETVQTSVGEAIAPLLEGGARGLTATLNEVGKSPAFEQLKDQFTEVGKSLNEAFSSDEFTKAAADITNLIGTSAVDAARNLATFLKENPKAIQEAAVSAGELAKTLFEAGKVVGGLIAQTAGAVATIGQAVGSVNSVISSVAGSTGLAKDVFTGITSIVSSVPGSVALLTTALEIAKGVVEQVKGVIENARILQAGGADKVGQQDALKAFGANDKDLQGLESRVQERTKKESIGGTGVGADVDRIRMEEGAKLTDELLARAKANKQKEVEATKTAEAQKTEAVKQGAAQAGAADQAALDQKLRRTDQEKQAKIAAIEAVAAKQGELDLKAQTLTQVDGAGLQQQSSELNAQLGLTKAIAEQEQQRAQFAVDSAKAKGDEGAALSALSGLQSAQSKGLEEQQKLELQIQENQAAQNLNKAQSADLQAQINVLVAEEAILKAQSEGKSASEIGLLQKKLELSKQIAAKASEGVKSQQRVNDITKKTTQVQQQTARERLRNDQSKSRDGLKKEFDKKDEQKKKGTDKAAKAEAKAERDAQKETEDRIKKVFDPIKRTAETASKRLDLTKDRFDSQNNVAKAASGLRVVGAEIGAKNAGSALDIRSKLEEEGLAENVKRTLENQLKGLGFNSTGNIEQDRAELAKAQYEREQQLAEIKRQALLQEQVAARSMLEFEIKKQEIAANILEIEAKRQLAIAKQSKDPEAIAAAQDGLALAKEQKTAVGLNANDQRQALALQQQGELASFDAQEADRRRQADLQRAQNDPNFVGGFGPTAVPNTTLPQDAPTMPPQMPTALLSQIGATLDSGFKRLEEAIRTLDRPNLTVVAKDPVSDAGTVQRDISRNRARAAGV